MTPAISGQDQMDCFLVSGEQASALEIAKTLHKTPAVVIYSVRCGKSSCRCRQGRLHGPYHFLFWRDDQGRQRRRYIRQGDVVPVEAIVRERQRADENARHQAQAAVEDLRQLRRWLREMERREP